MLNTIFHQSSKNQLFSVGHRRVVFTGSLRWLIGAQKLVDIELLTTILFERSAFHELRGKAIQIPRVEI